MVILFQIHDMIGKQEDLIYNPELAFNILNKYNLIDPTNKNKNQVF